MIKTTLCYIIKDNQYLMLYRDKNKHDPNYQKWLGLGGKCHKDETTDACMLREVKEESGLTITQYTYRGVVYFKSDRYPDETMHVYTATDFIGTIHSCDEGTLKWINKDDVLSLPMWEGDHHFLTHLNKDTAFFKVTLTYNNDTLTSVHTSFDK
jgi:8-oxo-dGTP diphosphatase